MSDAEPVREPEHVHPRLPTELSGVELRELAGPDAEALHSLVARNRAHLTEFGDYEDLVASSLEDLRGYFADPPDENLPMGIWRGTELMGRVDLVPVDPPDFGLGYWLGAEYCGRGYATAAVRALIGYSRQAFEVSAVWTGVKEANVKSRAVLERVGFSVVEVRPTHIRYRLVCDDR